MLRVMTDLSGASLTELHLLFYIPLQSLCCYQYLAQNIYFIGSTLRKDEISEKVEVEVNWSGAFAMHQRNHMCNIQTLPTAMARSHLDPQLKSVEQRQVESFPCT